MDTLNSSNDVLLVYIKRLGLIVILMAIMHAVTRNFFQLTFLHYAVFYGGSTPQAGLSIVKNIRINLPNGKPKCQK